ncbi:MAG: ACP S-malonyltransferase [Pseudomonadota bacterium]|nr:ACP S-malonyltransferase [Pseudomonadota bacterium]
MTRAFVFPGQGSQEVGMGQELSTAFPIARETLEEVDDALEQKLSRLIAEGPVEDLLLTENAQPALMAVSIAALRVLEKEGGIDVSECCSFLAGHSLGEYSSLAAGKALGLADTARLLRVRGRAMQRAVPIGKGGMAALLGADLDQAKEIANEAAQGAVCAPANDNGPGQVVLSGAMDAVERAIEIANERGIRRALKLPVSAPFHCELMAPAAEVMELELANVELVRPVIRVVANVTARPVDDPLEIRRLLVKQVTGMVRWRESVLAMREAGVDTLIEVGAGKVLTGLARRIDRDLTTLSVGTPGEVEAFLKTL